MNRQSKDFFFRSGRNLVILSGHMAHATEEVRRRVAAEYHWLKRQGTVKDLAKREGISLPTLHDWAAQFPPEDTAPAVHGNSQAEPGKGLEDTSNRLPDAKSVSERAPTVSK